MISRQEVIDRTKQKYSFANLTDEDAYRYGADDFAGQEIEPWDEVYKSKQKQEETSPGYVNALWEMTDYGVDENSADWMKAAYNNSLTGKAEELMAGKARYDLEDYNPGFWEDIGSTALSFLFPADVIAMATGGLIGKGIAAGSASKVGTKVATSLGMSDKVAGKAVTGMFSSAGTLSAYEGLMGGTQAAIDGKDAKGILSATAYGVMHGGAMGATIGFVGGGMGAKHAALAKGGQTYTQGAQKAMYAATSLPSAVAAEATIFSAPQMLDLAKNGIIDEEGNIRDARLKDYTKTWMHNVALIGVLKAQGKAQEKLLGNGKKLFNEAKEAKRAMNEKKLRSELEAIREQWHGEKEVTPETRQILEEAISGVEGKIGKMESGDLTRLDKILKLGKKSFDKDLEKNSDLLVSRINFLKEAESLATKKANNSTGKEREANRLVADEYRTELNKINKAISGHTIKDGKIVKVEAKDEYKISHRPYEEGPPAHDIWKDTGDGPMSPSDVLAKPEYYIGTGDRKSAVFKETKAAVENIKKIQGNPDAEITVYRSSPKNELNKGDWVSLSESYAKQEGRHPTDPSKDLPVYTHKIKAKDLKWDGNSLEEWGYFGKHTTPIKPAKKTEYQQHKETKKLESEKLKEESQKNLKDLNVKFEEQTKVDKAKEQEILKTADKAVVDRYNALEKKRADGTLDKQGKAQLYRLRKKLFKQGALDSAEAKVIKAEISKENKALRSIERNIQLIMGPPKKVIKPKKGTGTHDVLRTRSQTIGEITSAEVKSKDVNVEQTREIITGTKNLHKLGKTQLDVYLDFVSKSKKYKDRNIVEKKALYEASVAESISSIPVKKRMKIAQDLFDVERGQDYTSIKDPQKLADYAGQLRHYETNKYDSVKERIDAMNDKDAKLPLLGRYLMPVYKVVAKVSPSIANKLNLHLMTNATYQGSFSVAGSNIRKKLGRKYQDSLYLVDKERAKELKDNNQLTEKEKQFLKLSKDKDSPVYEAVKEYEALVETVWDALYKEVSKHNFIDKEKFEKDFSKKRVADYFTRRVTKEAMEGFKRKFNEIPEIEKILDKRVERAIEKKKKKDKVDELSDAQIERIRRKEELILFKYFTDPVANVDSSYFKERGEKLPEFLTLDGKQVRTYETKFSRTVDPYIINTSKFLSTVAHFPEYTKIGNEYGIGRTKGDLLTKGEFGIYVNQAIERTVGLDYHSNDILNRSFLKVGSAITNMSAAAGLSSPTSPIKNLVLGTRMIGHFGLWNTLKGYRRLFAPDTWAEARLEAKEKGAWDFQTRTLELGAETVKVPIISKEFTMKQVFKFNQMQRTENWNRAAAMFAGRTYFNGITKSLRGDNFHIFKGLSSAKAKRAMKEIFELTDGEVEFLRRTKDLENLSIDGLERMSIIDAKVDTFSHVATQGGTVPARLPLWMSNKYVRPFTLFTRIATSVTYDTYNNIMKPMYTHGNIAPFIATTATAYMGGAGLFKIYEHCFGLQKPAKPGDELDNAIANLHRGEYLGMLTELLNPYESNQGMPNPLMEPIIVRYMGNAWGGMQSWLQGTKSGKKAMHDFAKNTVVLYGHGFKAYEKLASPLHTDTKQIQTLVRKWQNQTGRKIGSGGSPTERTRLYRVLKEAFYFGGEKEFAQAYWAAYNTIATQLMKERAYNPKTRAGAKRIHRETKNAIRASLDSLKPVRLNNEGEGAFMNKSELKRFKEWLGNDKESIALLDRSMKNYEFKRRKLDKVIPNYFRSESVMAGFVARY